MKNPEWYNDIWRKKLDELPVNDDASSAWQQMQHMLDETQPSGDSVTGPGVFNGSLVKIIGGIVTVALLIAVIAYKMLHKGEGHKANNATSVKNSYQVETKERQANQPAQTHYHKEQTDFRSHADPHPQAADSNINGTAAKSNSASLNQGSPDDEAASDHLPNTTGATPNKNKLSKEAGSGTAVSDKPEKKQSVNNGYRKEKGEGSTGAATTLVPYPIAASAKLRRIKNKTGQTVFSGKSNREKENPDGTVFPTRPGHVNTESDPRGFSSNIEYTKEGANRLASSNGANAVKDKTARFVFPKNRDTTTLPASVLTDKRILAGETGYEALLKENIGPQIMAALQQRSKIKSLTGGGENGGGYSKIDMPGRNSVNGNTGTKDNKEGSGKFPKPKKRVVLNTPKYNYGAYLGLSNGSTNKSADIGIFGAYAFNQRWLINAGVYLNTVRSFSGTYSHQSFYRPDSLPSFTINDFRKAIAVNVPVKLEYKIMNLLSIKAGPLLSFTGSQQVVSTSYSVIKDRRDTLKHGTEIKTALSGTKVSKISPGFEAGLSFHLWKLDINGQYQWVAPYTISGTLGSYRNKYQSVNVGVGYRFK